MTHRYRKQSSAYQRRNGEKYRQISAMRIKAINYYVQNI